MHLNWSHIISVISGATFTGIVAHAVNTFPVPSNKYSIWILSVIQFAVGQRDNSAQTLKGLQK